MSTGESDAATEEEATEHAAGVSYRKNANALMVNDDDYHWVTNPSYLGTKWAIEAHRSGDRCPVSIHPDGGHHA